MPETPATISPAVPVATGIGGAAAGAIGASLAHGITQEQAAVVAMAVAIVGMGSAMWAQYLASQRRTEECEAEKATLNTQLLTQAARHGDEMSAMNDRMLAQGKAHSDELSLRSKAHSDELLRIATRFGDLLEKP